MSYIMTLPHPKGMWYLWGVSNPSINLQSNCITIQTLIIALLMYWGQNYGQTDRQTENLLTIKLLDAPGRPFKLQA